MRVQNNGSIGMQNMTGTSTTGSNAPGSPSSIDSGFTHPQPNAVITHNDGSTGALFLDQGGNITGSSLRDSAGKSIGGASFSPQTGEWQQQRYNNDGIGGRTTLVDNEGGGNFKAHDINGRSIDTGSNFTPTFGNGQASIHISDPVWGDDKLNTGNGQATGGGTQTAGGGAQATGGDTQSTGGGTQATGGDTQAAGGGAQSTGGGTQSTGGGTQATGGDTQATGGGTQATGGDTQAAGGGAQATGGDTQSTGGGTQATGGDTQAAGGSAQSTGADAQAAGGGSQASAGNGQQAIDDNQTQSSGTDAVEEPSDTSANADS